jgi:hypothetical protein
MIFKHAGMNELAHIVWTHGDTSSPRDHSTTEVLGAALEYNLGEFPTRKGMSYKLAELEAAMMLAGTYDQCAIARDAPGVDLSLFTEQAAYGPLLAKQLPKLVRALKRDPSTRRAVLYLGSKTTALSDRAPCTNTIQFLVRDGTLNLVVGMRSWDLVYGLPVDIAAFSLVGLAVAGFLGLLPGRFYAMAGSLHIYNTTMSKAVSGPVLLGTAWVEFPPEIEPRGWAVIVRQAVDMVKGGQRWLHAASIER